MEQMPEKVVEAIQVIASYASYATGLLGENPGELNRGGTVVIFNDGSGFMLAQPMDVRVDIDQKHLVFSHRGELMGGMTDEDIERLREWVRLKLGGDV